MTEPWIGRAMPRALSDADFAAAAERIGCEPAAIRAVWEVEAGGKHFLADGSVIRRFEPHHYPRQHWPAIGFSVRKGEAPWRASLRLSSERMFQTAAAIDADAAMRASSWGAPQIMGFNHDDAGFDGPRAMVEHMGHSAAHQLGAFVQLVETWRIDGAIRGHDWAAFARRYNGTGQPQVYARKIESAYRKHSGQASPVVLRVGSRGAPVRELQRALGIEADGAFGPGTLAAVRAFQAAAGLPVDGIVGARTWSALQAAGGSPDVPELLEVTPPAQPSQGEHITGRVGQLTGATGAAGAVVGSIVTLRDQLAQLVPDDLMSWVLTGALVLAGLGALMWLAARLFPRLAR